MSLNDRTPRRSERGTHLRLVHSSPPRIPAGSSARSTARQRIEIVPLPAPKPASVLTRLAPPMPVRHDRRRPEAHGSPGDAHSRLFCHACARRARIDLVDLTARRVHLSCDRCYRMWQEQIRADDPVRLRSRAER